MTAKDLRYPGKAKRYFIFSLLGLAGILLGTYMTISKIGISLTKYIAEVEYTVHGVHVIIGGAAIMILSKLIAKPSKKAMAEFRKNISEYNENKKDILVVNNLDLKNHKSLGTISVDGSSQEEAMQKVYLEAISRGANVVAINSTDVSTHRHTDITVGNYSASATTTNTDTFHIMGTIARDHKRPYRGKVNNLSDLSKLREQVIKDAADSGVKLKL